MTLDTIWPMVPHIFSTSATESHISVSFALQFEVTKTFANDPFPIFHKVIFKWNKQMRRFVMLLD